MLQRGFKNYNMQTSVCSTPPNGPQARRRTGGLCSCLLRNLRKAFFFQVHEFPQLLAQGREHGLSKPDWATEACQPHPWARELMIVDGIIETIEHAQVRARMDQVINSYYQIINIESLHSSLYQSKKYT